MKLNIGINNVTNAEYHADREYLSSSKLKLLLQDTEKFHKEVVLGNKEAEVDKPVFAEGSYVHSLILEPEKIQDEYVFFEGWRKAGKDWETFLKAQEGKNPKRILSTPQKHRCENWAESIRKRLNTVKFLIKGVAEHTICQIINDVKLKIRCDRINIEEGWIADIKTTGNPADLEMFKFTVKDYYYQLSAALYCLVAEQFYGKKFDFYFIVVSKADNICDIYRLSEKTKLEGMSMVIQALKIYKNCQNTGIWTNTAPKIEQNLTQYEILEV